MLDLPKQGQLATPCTPRRGFLRNVFAVAIARQCVFTQPRPRAVIRELFATAYRVPGRERKQPRVRREEAYDERCPSGRKASFRHFRRLARHNRITVSLDVLVNLLAQHSTFAKVKA